MEHVGSKQTGQRIGGAAVLVENDMDAVARERADEAPTIAEIDRHLGDRSHRLPVQHEPLAQQRVDGWLGIEQPAKEAAVRARLLFVEAASVVERVNLIKEVIRELR